MYNNKLRLFLYSSVAMWSAVLNRMTRLADRVYRSSDVRSHHFAAIVNKRGQILATGFNSGTEHAEEVAIRKFATRTHQPYIQKHKPEIYHRTSFPRERLSCREKGTWMSRTDQEQVGYKIKTSKIGKKRQKK